MATVRKAKAKRTKKKTARPQRPERALSEALAEAAWAEADAALALALVEFDHAEAAKKAETREEALALAQQALANAARRRGLQRFGAVGRQEPYDAARHELTAPRAKPPKNVRIVTPGVARGEAVLVKARASPLAQRRAKART